MAYSKISESAFAKHSARGLTRLKGHSRHDVNTSAASGIPAMMYVDAA